MYFYPMVILACLGYTVVNFVDELMEVKYQTEYETDFLEMFDKFLRGEALQPIPLAFKYLDEITLLGLCREYHKKWKIEYFYDKWIRQHEPKVEDDYLAFRRLKTWKSPLHPVLVQVVRCNETYALFASNDKYGYVLKLNGKSAEDKGKSVEDTGKSAEDNGRNVFHIYTRFWYIERQESQSEEVPSSVKSTASASVESSTQPSYDDDDQLTTPLLRRNANKKDDK